MNQLDLSCVKNLIKEGKMDSAIGKVYSKSLDIELYLTGFIPFYRDRKTRRPLSPDYKINEKTIITPNYIGSLRNPNFIPIFRSIDILGKDGYDELLAYLLKTENQNYHKKYEIYYIKDDNGEIIINPDKNDFHLSDGPGHRFCITNDFLCLCRYINSITGDHFYTILPSEDVIRVMTGNPILDKEKTKPLF